MKYFLVLHILFFSFGATALEQIMDKKNSIDFSSIQSDKKQAFLPIKYLRKFEGKSLKESLEAQTGNFKGKKVYFITYTTKNRGGTTTTSKYMNGIPFKQIVNVKRGQTRSKTIFSFKDLTTYPQAFNFPNKDEAISKYRKHFESKAFDVKSVSHYQRKNILTEIYHRKGKKMVRTSKDLAPYPNFHHGD